jgi:hypothetical protein
MRNETWPARVARIGETVDAIERAKASPPIIPITQTTPSQLDDKETFVREARR